MPYPYAQHRKRAGGIEVILLFAEIRKEMHFTAFVDASGKKLIFDNRQGATILFDSRNDEAEALLMKDKKLLQELSRQHGEVLHYSRSLTLPAVRSQAEMDPETIEQLKSLGYLK